MNNLTTYIAFDEQGNALQVGCCPEPFLYDQCPQAAHVIETAELLNVTEWYFEDQLIQKPAKPADYFTWDTASKAWVDLRTTESQWAVVRIERDQLLSATDWTQLPDVPQATQELYRAYRQELRDITQQSDPFNIVWPVKP